MVRLANAKNDALVITLVDKLFEVEVETFGEKQAQEEDKA